MEADRIALRRYESSRPKDKIKNFLMDDIGKFERLLRRVEYYKNCKKSKIDRFWYAFLYLRLYNKQVKLGFDIALNTFGPGLDIVHRGTIIVNGKAKIGSNCRIHPGVSIGQATGRPEEVPIIGDNVFIGPGAKIFGNITIADNIAIGANSVVNKSFLEPNITIAGVPAKKVSDMGTKSFLIDAAQIAAKGNSRSVIERNG